VENAMSLIERQAPFEMSAASPALPAQVDASSLARRERIGLAVAAIAAAGFVLRLWCARGPLALDEIWSIENLAPLHHFWQVFWGISHDNNHFLNSLWLYFAVGWTSDEVVLRAPSIAMGALTIAMMARLGARHGPAAALAAAAMTALSYFFVNYSVEARGYSGSALALVIGFDALERCIAKPASRARLTLAAAMGIGLLWHLAILPAIGLFALICFVERWRRTRLWEPSLAATLRIFVPTLLAILPALAFVVAGSLVVGSFTIGGVRAFDAAAASTAIANMARDAVGLSFAAPDWLILLPLAAVVVAALRSPFVLDERKFAYGLILLALPAAVFVLRPPNAHIARYYLICALFLILLLAEIFGALWAAGAWKRLLAAAALAAILVGDAGLVLRFQASKASNWPQALEAISDSGQTLVASSFDDRVGKLVAYYNRTHPPLALVARDRWCAQRPRWFIADTAGIVDLPLSLDLAAGDCRAHFDFVRRYENWGLSQVGWALYRAS
jgi:hypothetical protein